MMIVVMMMPMMMVAPVYDGVNRSKESRPSLVVESQDDARLERIKDQGSSGEDQGSRIRDRLERIKVIFVDQDEYEDHFLNMKKGKMVLSFKVLLWEECGCNVQELGTNRVEDQEGFGGLRSSRRHT